MGDRARGYFHPLPERTTVTRMTDAAGLSFPSKGLLYRGGGFRNEHKHFFKKGKQTRVPGFLACSAIERVAKNFAFNADKNFPCIEWLVKVDPRGESQIEYRLKHMSYIENTLVPGEGEYLFVPYSVFKITSVHWSNTNAKPHRITLCAAVDNAKCSEDLPL